MQYVEEIKRLVIEVGDMAADNIGQNLSVEIKNDNSPVTRIDKLVSAIIVAKLQELTPHIPIVSEEEALPEFN